MKGLRKILRVSWKATKTNEWVLNKAGLKMDLLDGKSCFKLGPKLKLKHHFMFPLNFGFKPPFGFKRWY